jgi:hypothetical protein
MSITCKSCRLSFELDIFISGVTEGDCPECGRRLSVPPTLRAEVRKMIENHKRAEDEEYEQLMNSPNIPIKVFIHGRTITLQVKAWHLINNIKAQIRDKEGIPMDRFDLVMYRQGKLDEQKEVSDYLIEADSQLHVIVENCPSEDRECKKARPSEDRGCAKACPPLKGSVLAHKEIYEAFGGPGSWNAQASSSSGK